METEWTYLMLISKLIKDVGEDPTIQQNIKDMFLNKIDEAQELIEPFSS